MKIAIILSGCGNRDGSELQESLSIMLAIDRRGWHYQCFAPQATFAVVSHVDGKERGDRRDLFVEAARVARGNILPLDEYSASDFDALALPGGMGAARNLSTYAFDNEAMGVRPDVEHAILQTYEAKKPLLAVCIAPMVLAKVLGSLGVTVTLGQGCPASHAATLLGARHQCCQATEVCVDRQHRVFTTPAYMVATHISQIFEGADNLIGELQDYFKCSSKV